MLELGPKTKEFLATPHDWQSFRSSAGHFRVDMIQEFKNWASNNKRRKALELIFTMRDYEFNDLVSIKQIYMNSVDEYDCAIKCFGSWDHWLYLCNRKDFLNGRSTLRGQWTGIKDWREEKRLMEQNAAKKVILSLADKGNFAAAKMLFENTQIKNGAGRPSNEKVLQKVTEMAEHDIKVAEDAKRIRLAINNTLKTKKNASE